MNLQNYGVQELNTRELQTTDGGILPLIIIFDVFMVSFLAGAYYELQQ